MGGWRRLTARRPADGDAEIKRMYVSPAAAAARAGPADAGRGRAHRGRGGGAAPGAQHRPAPARGDRAVRAARATRPVAPFGHYACHGEALFFAKPLTGVRGRRAERRVARRGRAGDARARPAEAGRARPSGAGRSAAGDLAGLQAGRADVDAGGGCRARRARGRSARSGSTGGGYGGGSGRRTCRNPDPCRRHRRRWPRGTPRMQMDRTDVPVRRRRHRRAGQPHESNRLHDDGGQTGPRPRRPVARTAVVAARRSAQYRAADRRVARATRSERRTWPVRAAACARGWPCSTRWTPPPCAAGAAPPSSASPPTAARSTRSTSSRSPTATPATTCSPPCAAGGRRAGRGAARPDAAAATPPRRSRPSPRGAARGAVGNSGFIVSQILRGLAEATRGGRHVRRRRRRGRAATPAPGARPRRGRRRRSQGTILTVARAAADAATACPQRWARLAGRRRRGRRRGGRSRCRRTTAQLAELAEHGVVDAGGRGSGRAARRPGARRHRCGRASSPRSPPAGRAAAARRPARPAATGSASRCSTCSTPPAAAVDAAAPRARDHRRLRRGRRDRRRHLEGPRPRQRRRRGHRGGHRGRPAAPRSRSCASPTTPTRDAAARRTTPPHRAASAVVAVAPGAGLAHLFEAEGVHVVEGGRTAPPPSTDDVLAAIHATGARDVVLLPNASRVDGVAEAAARAGARRAGCGCAVVPTRSPVQGLAAIAVHDPARRFDDDVVAMAEAAAATRFAEITRGRRPRRSPPSASASPATSSASSTARWSRSVAAARGRLRPRRPAARRSAPS